MFETPGRVVRSTEINGLLPTHVLGDPHPPSPMRSILSRRSPGDSAAVAAVKSGIRRQVGIAELRRAEPLELEPLELRAGYATAAAGVEERKIANVTRHKNLPVLRK
jgi:hypothetical protein